MDTMFGVGDAAELTGVSPPTIRVVADTEHIGTRTKGGHRRFTREDLDRIVAKVGVTPRVEGFSSSEVRMLRALAHSPTGVASARVAAGRAGISPTSASAALKSLARRGLVTAYTRPVAAGKVQDLTSWHLVISPEWLEIAPQVMRAEPPQADDPLPEPRRVPQRFWHLFWTGDPARLRLPDDAVFVARRLLESQEAAAIGWAVARLPADALREAAGARGWSPRLRALALNAAAAHG